MPDIKNNVNVFNRDVAENDGYRYTTNAPYSSLVANRRQTQATLACIEQHRVRSIIDIGCGDGTYTGEIQERCPAVEIVGVDAAAEAVKLASRRYPNIRFEVLNVLDRESFPARRYDLAIFRGVLHHLSNPALAIANAREVADKLLIIEPNGNNGILKIIEKTSRYHIEHEEQSFSSLKLKRWCRDAGFEILTLDYIGFVPFFFPEAPAKVIYAVQPLLEKIPVLRHLFSGQIVITCADPRAAGNARAAAS